jgi:hypothetical protein
MVFCGSPGGIHWARETATKEQEKPDSRLPVTEPSLHPVTSRIMCSVKCSRVTFTLNR